MSVSQQQKNKQRQSRSRKYKKLVKIQRKEVSRVLAKKTLTAEEIKKSISETQKILDKAARKGVIHSHKSARIKSKIQKKFNQLKASQNI